MGFDEGIGKGGFMRKRIALVTGANSGMGKATIAALADKGIHVVMACRSKERGLQAYKEITQNVERDVALMLCDLGDMNSIRSFTDEFKQRYTYLDILINNAGVISLDRRETKDGLEEQFGVNHIGHFLLTLRVLPLIRTGGRIVVVTSGAHKQGKIDLEDIELKKGFNVISAYGRSKLANVLFTRELALRLKDRGITVNCCHPGAVATQMGVDRTTGFGTTLTTFLKPFFKSPEEGARTAIFLATDPQVALITGQYFEKCKVEKGSKRSYDKKKGEALFALSEKISEEYFES
jgi:NAD(P)-dependent dehydrogenase (short-subunit alcohol dehydrogenase family)